MNSTRPDASMNVFPVCLNQHVQWFGIQINRFAVFHKWSGIHIEMQRLDYFNLVARSWNFQTKVPPTHPPTQFYFLEALTLPPKSWWLEVTAPFVIPLCSVEGKEAQRNCPPDCGRCWRWSSRDLAGLEEPLEVILLLPPEHFLHSAFSPLHPHP